MPSPGPPAATSTVISTTSTSSWRPLPWLAGRNPAILTREGIGRDPAVLAGERLDPGQPVKIGSFWPGKGQIPANRPEFDRFGCFWNFYGEGHFSVYIHEFF
jgi:hypothetical protein